MPCLGGCTRLGVSAVGPENSLSTPSLVAFFAKKDLLLSTWVVDEPQKKQELLAAGGSITSNFLFREDARALRLPPPPQEPLPHSQPPVNSAGIPT